MKKGTKLVALLLGLALVAPACNKPATTSQPQSEPGTSEPTSAPADSSAAPTDSSVAPVNYKVTISNKTDLQAEWFVGDASRKVNIEVDPKANVTQLVNEGKITITSSDTNKLTITGQMASPVAAGEVTITIKCGDSTDSVKVTLQAKQTVKEKYGVAHEGTEADPFDNEDACKVAKSEKYNNEDFYVKGVVSSFYYAPGSRTDGSVAFYLTPAEGKTEKFEVFKCYKDKEQKQPLTDDDIWVGGTVTAHGQFTVYNNTQAETTSAIFVKCEGNKPQPRKTIEGKSFAEVLAIGAALQDGADSYDYYKFQGFVTAKSGNDYFLTATKGEALVPGKSDKDHGERDIKGTNAIELFGAGKVEALAAKLLEGAKVEVTMVVKNYHGTVENGFDLKDADVTVIEAGTKWSVPEPAVAKKTVTEFVAVENKKDKAYEVEATIKAWKNEAADKYGNMTVTDGTTDLVMYGVSATATALAWDGAGAYSFSNPQDFLTNETTKALKVGDKITLKMIRADYNGTVQGSGIITKVGGGEGGEGGGGDTQKEYASVAKYTFTTQTEGNTRSIAADVVKNVFTKATGEEILDTVSEASSIYEGANGGSGDTAWTLFNILKIGKSKTAGKLVFKVTKDVSKIAVSGDSWTKTSTLTINGVTISEAFKDNVISKDVIADGKLTNAGKLEFEFDATKEITIECGNTNANANFGIVLQDMEFFAESKTPAAANEVLPWYTEGADNQAIHFEGAGIWTWVNYGAMGYADFAAFNAAKANIVAAYVSEPAATINEVVVSDDIAASKVCRVYIVLSAAYNTGVLTLKIPGADGKTYEGSLEFAAGKLSKINGVAAPLKVWNAADVKAGLSNASAKEVKDTTGDVQFTVYKLGTKNDYVEFKFTPTEAKKVVFNYTFTTKAGNATKTFFWHQDAAVTSNVKHNVYVNGTKIDAPADSNPSFQDFAGGADKVIESEADDGGKLANPITVALFEFDLVANQENVIKIEYVGSGYSTYVAGASLIAK